jgi:transcriptional regulator with XRE-family HTH domain
MRDDEGTAPARLARYIIERREQLGLTQAQIADRAGLARAEMNAIEKGRIKLPGAYKRRALASALGVRHIDLFIAAGEIEPDEVPTTNRPAIDEAPAGSVRAELCATIMGLTEAEALVLAPIVGPQIPIAREVAAARAARRQSVRGEQ